MSVFNVGKDGGMTVGETLILIDPMEGLLTQVCNRKALAAQEGRGDGAISKIRRSVFMLK